MKPATFLMAFCLTVAGCAAVPTDHPRMSPAQAYYAADRAYENALAQAVEYRDQCIGTAKHLRGNCYEVVQIMRRVNREAQEVRELAELAVQDENDDLLEEAAERLEDLRQQLRAELIAKIEKDQAAAAGQGATP